MMTPHRAARAPRRRWALLATLCLLVAAPGCDSKSRGEEQSAASSDSDEVANQKRASERDDDRGREPPTEADLDDYTDPFDGQGALVATIDTELGDITCELHEERAPRTVANFVGLATGQKEWRDPETDELMEDAPFYEGVVFHRVIPDFLIQAGDRTSTGTGGPGYTIPDEFDASLEHDRPGVLSMANKGRPDSGGSQWFITLTAAPHLDGRHTVFGQCEDFDIVEEIAALPTGPDNRPNDPPEINQINIERANQKRSD